MIRVATKVEEFAETGAIPFVIDCGNGWADYGYSATSWLIDLWEWLNKSSPSTVPDTYRNRICGLLLGYSPEAIRRFEEEGSERRFSGLSTESHEPESM